MRSKDNVMYYDFIHFFVSAVIGKMDYKRKLCSMVLSKYATVSDEAFALLNFENNIDTWMDMGRTGDTKTSKVPHKYTNGGSSKGKNGTSQHNKGWSDEGLRGFNELFDLVQKNRDSQHAKQFEEDFRKWCEAKALEKQKKVEKIFNEAIKVRHKLWSDDEDEMEDANDNPYYGTDHKRMKIGDVSESCLFAEAKQFKNDIMATPPRCNDDEDSEEESEGPMPDRSVFV